MEVDSIFYLFICVVMYWQKLFWWSKGISMISIMLDLPCRWTTINIEGGCDGILIQNIIALKDQVLLWEKKMNQTWIIILMIFVLLLCCMVLIFIYVYIEIFWTIFHGHLFWGFYVFLYMYNQWDLGTWRITLVCFTRCQVVFILPLFEHNHVQFFWVFVLGFPCHSYQFICEYKGLN